MRTRGERVHTCARFTAHDTGDKHDSVIPFLVAFASFFFIPPCPFDRFAPVLSHSRYVDTVLLTKKGAMGENEKVGDEANNEKALVAPVSDNESRLTRLVSTDVE